VDNEDTREGESMITDDRKPNPLKKTRERANNTPGAVPYIMAILFLAFLLGLLVLANIWVWGQIF